MTTPLVRSPLTRLRAVACSLGILATLSLLSGCSGDDNGSPGAAKDAPPTADEVAFCETYVELLRAQQTLTLKPKANNSADLKALAERANKLTRPESLSEGGFKTLQVQADFFARYDPLSAKGQKVFQERLAELGPEAFGDLSAFTSKKCLPQLEQLAKEASPAVPAATMSPATPATQDTTQP